MLQFIFYHNLNTPLCIFGRNSKSQYSFILSYITRNTNPHLHPRVTIPFQRTIPDSRTDRAKHEKQQFQIKLKYYYLKFLIHSQTGLSGPSGFLSLFLHHGCRFAIRFGTLFMLLEESLLFRL